MGNLKNTRRNVDMGINNGAQEDYNKN